MSVVEPRQNALPQKYISTLWKGAVIGGTMLVPGVSGGRTDSSRYQCFLSSFAAGSL